MSQQEEKLKLSIMGSLGEDGKINLENLKSNLGAYNISYEDNNKFPLKVKINEKIISIKNDGEYSSSKVGMYDIVNKKFHENSGDGVFSYKE